MKKKGVFIIFMIGILSMFIFTGCSSETAEDRFNLYVKVWEEKNYEDMYSFLTQGSKEYIGKEEFIERYTKIYSGIEAENIKITINNDKKDKDTLNFNLKMDTIAGEIDLDGYKAKMIKEKREDKDTWFIEWDESLIFPGMEKEDKVGVRTLPGLRGEIYDKDGNGLAINGLRYRVGIHPAKYKEEKTQELANVLDIDSSIIKEKLDKNKNPEFFVPLVKISVEDFELLEKLVNIDGVKLEDVDDRIYPGGEAFGSLVGYIRPITAEELEKDEEKFYHNTSLIGKAGLETVYEKTLRAKDGKEVFITKIKDEEVLEEILLASVKEKDGDNLTITVNSDLQNKIYQEMNGELGAASAIDPKTGQVLAMVSSPSFDSNLYTTYISNSQRKEWEAMEVNVFENRFNNATSPGSTFKVVTGAIGLEKGLIDPDEKISIEGKSWQKDSSWGSYRINRVSQKLSTIDLRDAYIYSDNIYFAQAALKIGEKDFIEETKKYGFGEDLPINYPFAQSQITNSGKIEKEVLLADTGYGQGQILMSPLHVSLVYSMLVNDGNIMEPLLEKKEDGNFKIWKEGLVSKENKDIILEDLVQVIEDKDGSGHDGKIENIKLAGKTGTAELKATQDSKGQENGWFVSMNVDDPKIVVAMMIEGVEDRGGSHFVVPLVRNIIEDYLK